ncbi:MAG: T9SS type A sorting domain-containing protein [Salinivirgaceae bacterium]|jgi:photosystem II stability/assembly factor-like uncharacterized protein|nr:T9SS type A sorting domain-containing protein [Salinivirgaceae bacterium]
MKKLTLLLGLAFLSFNAFSQWTQINDEVFQSAEAQEMVYTSNGDVILATTSGIFKTADKGLNWNYSSTGLNDLDVKDVLEFNNVLYALGQVIYASSDNGDTWAEASMTGLPEGSEVNAVGKSADKLFSIIRTWEPDMFAIYYSSDGVSWTEGAQLSYGEEGYNTVDISNSVFYFIDPFEKLLYTSDGINVDTIPETGFSVENIIGEPDNGKIYYVSEPDVYSYNSSTEEWEDISAGLPTADEFIGVAANDVIFIAAMSYSEGYSFAFYRSIDHGATWEQIFNTPLSSKIVKTGANELMGTDAFFGKTYFSTDNGDTWEQRTNGLLGSYAEIVCAIDNTLLIETEMSGVIKSSDYGVTWNYANDGMAASFGNIYNVHLLYTVGSSAYIVGFDMDTWSFILYKSTDLAENWTVLTTLPEFEGGPGYMGKAGDTFFLRFGSSTNGYSYQMSSDGGETWTDITANLPTNNINRYHSFNGKAGAMFLYAENSEGNCTIYMSVDNGATWTEEMDGIEGSPVLKGAPERGQMPLMAFGENNEHVYIPVIDQVGEEEIIRLYVYNSTTSSWDEILPGFTSLKGSLEVADFKYLNGKWLLLSESDFYISEDNCQNWTQGDMENLIPGMWLKTVEFVGEDFFIGTQANGIWKNSNIYTNISPINNTTFSLYPNPSSGFITLNNSDNSIQSVEIINMNGQIIFKEQLNSTTSRINVQNLSKGIYIVKIKSDNFVKTEKLIIE